MKTVIRLIAVFAVLAATAVHYGWSYTFAWYAGTIVVFTAIYFVGRAIRAKTRSDVPSLSLSERALADSQRERV